MRDRLKSGLGAFRPLELVWLARLQGSTVGLVRSQENDTHHNHEPLDAEGVQEELCELALTILRQLRPATLAQASKPSSSG